MKSFYRASSFFKRINHVTILLILYIVFGSCASVNLKNYYFPLNKEDNVMVYVYTCEHDPKFTEYWKITVDPNRGTLRTDSYRYDFELYNTFTESYEEYGAELQEYVDYEYDKEGAKKEIISEVLEKDVFKWDGQKSYNFSLKYDNKFGRFNFLKRRTSLGFQKIEHKNESYKAIKFKDEYFVHAIDQNDKYSFYQISYYVKDKGMIKYERFIPNSGKRVIEFDKLITEDQFYKLKAIFMASKKNMEDDRLK